MVDLITTSGYVTKYLHNASDALDEPGGKRKSAQWLREAILDIATDAVYIVNDVVWMNDELLYSCVADLLHDIANDMDELGGKVNNA